MKTNMNKRIESQRQQWNIELLTIARTLIFRATRDESGMCGWDSLGELDDLIDYKLEKQREVGMYDRELQFIDHVLGNMDCEFNDDMCKHVGERFTLLYMNDIADVD